MIAPPHLVIERQTCVAAFGIAFWDTAAGRLAGEGLRVHVAPQVAGHTLAPVLAPPNRRGVFVIHRLPIAVTDSPPVSLLVDVRDPLGRFLPFVMHLEPDAAPGLIAPPCLAAIDLPSSDSPPAAAGSLFVPLVSTPARTPPAGSAVVRAALVDAGRREPAAFALLEVRDAGRLLGRGVADGRGEVAVAFPYPEPSVLPPWSPPARPAPPTPLIAQSWPLEVAVRYRRALPRYAALASRGAPPAPDLCELLTQPHATLATASPAVPVTGFTVHYGQEFVLAGPDGGPLVVDPASPDS